jgi:dTDP-4-amino-4,6-dideoxygalactose transaminase
MQSIAFNDLSRQSEHLRELTLAAMRRVVDRGWFIHGPELEAFEKGFADYCGVPHAVGVANGTDAIELALRALNVTPDDEVIVAANASMYAVTALRAIGATPVFADIDDVHLVLDAASAEKAITKKTRAVVATHLYGRMADMPAFRALADAHGIALIEDCAQAHGARQQGRTAGAWGDAASFSFYPTKNLGAFGDGGLVTCSKPAIAARLRRLRQYGWDRKYHVVDGPARNSRLDEIQAAVLLAKLPLLDAANARRRHIAQCYAATLNPSLRHPDVAGDDYVAHLYVVRTDARDSLRAHCDAHGVANDIHYPILDTDQPIMQSSARAKPSLPNSERATRQILSLPCYPEMRDEEVERVCAVLLAWKP